MREPLDIDRDAPVVVHLERRMAAPTARLWELHTDVTRWPQWQHDIRSASIDGPFAAGSTITWQTSRACYIYLHIKINAASSGS